MATPKGSKVWNEVNFEMLEALELILNDNRLMNAMSKEQARAVMYSVAKARGEK